MITQKEWVEGCYAYYAENGYEPNNPEDGEWHDAHYPVPECKFGTETIPLLKQHHAIQGVLQSEEYQHPCIWGWEKPYLQGEVLALYRKWKGEAGHRCATATNAARTPEERSAAARKASLSRTTEDRSAGARKANATHTTEERSAAAREAQSKRAPEERSASARKANAALTSEQRSARTRKANAARTPEERRAISRKANAARWANRAASK